MCILISDSAKFAVVNCQFCRFLHSLLLKRALGSSNGMLILSSDEKGYSSQIYQNKQGVCLRMKDCINESCCYSPVL